MTTSNSTTINMSDDDNFSSNHRRGYGKRSWRKGKWSTMNIAAMVLGFVFFWPAGLFLLFWIISGRNVKELPHAIQNLWNKVFSGSERPMKGSTDNSIFNEFQQTQFDRIREIKDEIKDRAQRFGDFRTDAKRKADEDEFKNFMANRQTNDQSTDEHEKKDK